MMTSLAEGPDRQAKWRGHNRQQADTMHATDERQVALGQLLSSSFACTVRVVVKVCAEQRQGVFSIMNRC